MECSQWENMCVALPGRVLSIKENKAVVDFQGNQVTAEAGLVKEACGAAFQTVTPGIRFADSAADDQARVMTPEKARLGGSDYIVVGRPITQASDPVAAYRRCVKEFLGE